MGKQKHENLTLIAGIYKGSALSDPHLTSDKKEHRDSRMEEEPSGSKRKAPSCSRCSNHGEQIPLTHHKCPYEECDCLLCKLTWARKIVMRRQQQLWRQQKETKRWEEAVEGGGGDSEESEGKQKQKYCDMCRNHGVLTKNRGHKRSCPRETCMCDLCSFTRKRRHIMQLQQKVKRSNITTQQFHEATEWVTKLTEELASLGIDDVPNIPTSIPTIPTTSAFPSHRPPQGPEGPFPSPASLFPASYPIEPFPNSSSSASSRMAPRSFLPTGPVGQYPSAPFHVEPSSPSTAGASSFPSTPSVIRIPPQDSSSSYASLCPPSPSYTSPSASPIVDYDSPPLLSYPCSVDDANCEMISQSQPCSTVIRDTPSAEPLDYSTHLMRTSGAHKYNENRHQSNTEVSDIHANRAIHSNPQSGAQCWGGEQRPGDERTHEKYWPGQRRCSEGVLQSVYMQNQRRNSDSGIQGIYRPSQRRHSDGVIKKCYPSQRGSSDNVIQENYLPEERKDNSEGFQGHYKADMRDSRDVPEETYGAENRTPDIHHHVDQRRNSDGVISTNYRHYHRRHSDGVIRQCLNVNPRGIYDRMVQKGYMLNSPEFSDEGAHSSYSHSDRRSSDELSQGSYLVDQRRSSIDSIQENYECDESNNSNEAVKAYYWPYPRSDSGDAIHENEWPFRRRNSDEIFQGEYQLNKEHFFENTLRREHEVLEKMERVIPMNISKNNSNEERPYYKGHPASVVSIQQGAVILKPTGVSRDEDIETENNMMNWSEHSQHEGTGVHSETVQKENYEDMDVPIDLSVRSSTRL